MVFPNSEILPDFLDEDANLFLWPPYRHTLMKLTAICQSYNILSPFQPGQNYLALHHWHHNLNLFLQDITTGLSPQECQDTRVLLSPQSHFCMDDFAKVISLQQFVGFAESQWLLSLLKEDQLFSLYQGIYNIRDPHMSLWAIESLLRGAQPSSSPIKGKILFAAAKKSNLTAPLDLQGRIKAIEGYGRAQARHLSLFINLSPSAIYDPHYCLKSTVQLINSLGIAHNQIIFEITEAHPYTDLAHLQKLVQTLLEYGFQVSFDEVGTVYNDIDFIKKFTPSHIKISHQLIHNIHQDPLKKSFLEKLIHECQTLNIKIIAKGIENMEELYWCREHGFNYAQGYLLSKPQPIEAYSDIITPPSFAQQATRGIDRFA